MERCAASEDGRDHHPRGEGMTVADLATKLDVKAKDVLRKLMGSA